VDKNYLAQNFLAFFKRDYKRVAEAHIESGWAPKGTRVDEFEAAIRSVCEPFFDRPLKEISLGRVLLRLFQTSRQFNVEVQPQLVLLQKTLLNVEGLGRELDPDLDLWQTALPYLERWMSEQLGLAGAGEQHQARGDQLGPPAADPAAPGAPGADGHRDAGAQPGAGKPRRRSARPAPVALAGIRGRRGALAFAFLRA
jgi:hypothetical protein